MSNKIIIIIIIYLVLSLMSILALKLWGRSWEKQVGWPTKKKATLHACKHMHGWWCFEESKLGKFWLKAADCMGVMISEVLMAKLNVASGVDGRGSQWYSLSLFDFSTCGGFLLAKNGNLDAAAYR